MAIEHTFRTKDGETTKKITALQAIKAHCMECLGWKYQEVVGCTSQKCALYPYRLGKTGQKRELTEEQRRALRERFKK